MNRAQIVLDDAKLERESASKEIAILIGAPEYTQYEIVDSLEHLSMDLDENVLYRQLAAQSPQLQRAYADLKTAKARVNKECNEAGINVNREGSVLYNTYDKQTEVSFGAVFLCGFTIRIRQYHKGAFRNVGGIL